MHSSLSSLRTLALAACVLLSIASAAATPVLPRPTGSFSRFTAAYVDPTEIGIDVGWGGFAAIGARFGDGEASAELGQMRFDQSEEGSLLGYDIAGTADLRITTAMVGGRYGVRLGSTDRVRLMFGGAVGFAHLAFSGSSQIEGDTYALKTNSTGAAWALDLGLAVALSEKIELSAGYRYMSVEGTTWEEYGYELEIPTQGANLWQVGLAYRW